MHVDLREAKLAILIDKYRATPIWSLIRPNDTELPAIVVPLFDDVISTQVAGKTAEYPGIIHLFVDDLFQLPGCHGPPPKKRMCQSSLCHVCRSVTAT